MKQQVFWLRFITLLLLPLCMSACSDKPAVTPGLKIGKPYQIYGKWYKPAFEPDYTEEGIASWYGPGFHGNYTASGERFDKNTLTAAHTTLPMPSIVRVTNLDNGKTVKVRVNDRGPFASNRIIDLSKKAAQELDMIKTGTARVRVDYLREETMAYLEENDIKGRDKILASDATRDLNRRALSKVQNQDINQVAQDVPETLDSKEDIHAIRPVYRVQNSKSPDPVIKEAAFVPTSGKNEVVVQEVEMVDGSSSGISNSNASGTSNPREIIDVKMVQSKPSLKDAFDYADDPSQKPSSESKPVRNNVVKSSVSNLVKTGIFVQAGTFSNKENATRLGDKLSDVGPVNISDVAHSDATLYRVRIGPFSSKNEAETALQKIYNLGISDAKTVKVSE